MLLNYMWVSQCRELRKTNKNLEDFFASVKSCTTLEN